MAQTLRDQYKRKTYGERVGELLELVHINGPLFYDEIASLMRVSRASVGKYASGAIMVSSLKTFNFHFSTNSKANSTRDLFTEHIQHYENRALLMDPESMDHLQILYEKFEKCLLPTYTGFQTAAVTNRIKNVFPKPVEDILLESLKIRRV